MSRRGRRRGSGDEYQIEEGEVEEEYQVKKEEEDEEKEEAEDRRRGGRGSR